MARAAIIEEKFSLEYTDFEFYGFSSIDQSELSNALDRLTAVEPFLVTFEYDDSKEFANSWLNGDNGIGEFGQGDDILESTFTPARGAIWYNLNDFDLSALFNLIDSLLTEFPSETLFDDNNYSEAYYVGSPDFSDFAISRDHYTFQLDNRLSGADSRMVIYLNNGDQLAVNFDFSLVSRTVTVNDPVTVAEPSSILLIIACLILLFGYRYHSRHKTF